ncbi:hypothetical protein GE21DRAFT_4904 [Neurospora crassa]|uniref:Uncharacterized protein n=1 Tax=Neurospora crassa (strain ATCC 24698 / 74-OR23-1A / CBS 708.71 / DSM 1257 / FGSC 987) TaxID=367110 RepID=Q7S119_NEUCR|nr:hypothetical protein NCU07573 [Neurospora crassa OR74A]EAA29031.3 hypothetical protein NCU07573 [Neurospora crassa OR74A]KHE78743.1 hypothetical protein GE21DRAFT_4904 [Neurospora crassa]|eukprot:XP_958267.3 hypothetical protein NCU07573 [Neurospora crassa OR74A]
MTPSVVESQVFCGFLTNSHNDSLPPMTENRAAYSGNLLNQSATDGLSGGMQGTAQGRVNFSPGKGSFSRYCYSEKVTGIRTSLFKFQNIIELRGGGHASGFA